MSFVLVLLVWSLSSGYSSALTILETKPHVYEVFADGSRSENKVDWKIFCEPGKHEFLPDAKFWFDKDDLYTIDNWVPEEQLNMYCY